ncbi:MAG: hypothetical protein R3C18_00525 [Planctomycetaceae bacterium]
MLNFILGLLILMVPIVAIGGLVYALVVWKASWTRKAVEDFLYEENIDADVISCGMPPLSLWLRNRKGDGWAKIEYADGDIAWVRVRNSIFTGRRIDIFDDF